MNGTEIIALLSNPVLLPSSFGRKLTGTFDRTLTSNMTALG